MKTIFLLFNGFHRTGTVSIRFQPFNPIQDGRRGEFEKGSLLVSLITFDF